MCRFGNSIYVLWWWVHPDRGIQIPLWRPFGRFLWCGIGEMILTGGFLDSVGCLWMLGPWCWQPFVVGNYWIFLFPNFYLFSFFSLWLTLVYVMMILNMIMHTTVTPGRGNGGGHVK